MKPISRELETSLCEKDVTVSFTFYPGEPMIMNPIERAYPGSPPEIEITGVLYQEEGSTIVNLLDLLDDETKEKLEQECFTYMEEEEDEY